MVAREALNGETVLLEVFLVQDMCVFGGEGEVGGEKFICERAICVRCRF